jgi:hypothetical protein
VILASGEDVARWYAVDRPMGPPPMMRVVLLDVDMDLEAHFT